MADYYQLLGVSRDASLDDIKRAYRQRARELHPDANPGDATAEARFKEVAQAYAVLSDPAQRQRYDQYGDAGPGAGRGADPFGGMGGMSDIFEAFFGGGANPFGGGRRGPTRGADVEVVLDLEFESAVFGGAHDIAVRAAVACATCGGSGAAAGSAPITCVACAGSGQVQRVRQSLLGQVVTSGPCPRCGGRGSVVTEACTACRGDGRITEDRTLTVEVPAGVATGTTLRLAGRGAAGPQGGPAGDLFVHVRVGGHDRFERDGDDLLADLHVSYPQAALGTVLALESLDGEVEVTVAAGTPSGHEVRFRGKGVPHVQGRGRGDLVVQVVVDTPDELSEEEDGLLRRLAELRDEPVSPPPQGFFKRLRSAFG